MNQTGGRLNFLPPDNLRQFEARLAGKSSENIFGL
jgi:hypothetical protein